jgi:adenylate kinase family enzyme
MLAVVAGPSRSRWRPEDPGADPPEGDGARRIREGQKSFIPLRVNSAGVMPIIFAQSIIIVPGTLAAFSRSRWLKTLLAGSSTGRAYYVSFGLLIVFFTYFYTAIIFNPVDLAENLKKQGAFIPGVKPGARTAEYIDRVLTRISLPGSLFLAAIALLPVGSAGSSASLPGRASSGGTGPADRGRRGARHGAADAAAPAAPALRRLHEEGSREVPRTAALHVDVIGSGTVTGGFRAGGTRLRRRLSSGPGAAGADSTELLSFDASRSSSVRPGAGKGTQGARLAERLGIRRSPRATCCGRRSAGDTPLGRRRRRFMDAGELVPDEVILGMVREALAGARRADGAIFDGFPRNVAQAGASTTILSEAGAAASTPWSCSRWTTMRSSSGWRAAHRPGDGEVYHVRAQPAARGDRGARGAAEDDREETVRHRLAVYAESTAPLVAVLR